MRSALDSFPAIMPGEALYSAIACYHLWSGNDAGVHSHQELFGVRAVRATFDLPNSIAALAERLPPERGLTAGRLARDHTLIGYATAFLPRSEAEAAVAKLVAGDPSLHLALGVNASVVARPSHLRFCPECVVGMRASAGRLWWRLDQQLPGVLVCPEHGCELMRSTVAYASGQFVFEPATERTCPPDAESVVAVSEGRIGMQLREVARRSAALVTAMPAFDGYEAITNHYRGALFDAGLMITERHLDVPKFMDAFRADMGGLLDVLAACFDKMASPDAWILEMARKHVQAKHPLQHVLFQMFLDGRPRRVPPFGPGPWTCPNPVAPHGKDAATITMVREKRDGYGLTGTFECACGYAYTMSIAADGTRRGPRYKCFGPLLDPALTELVAGGATLRGSAAALGIHPRAVAAAAKRLDLGKAWKVNENAGARLGRAVASAPRPRKVADPQVSRRPSTPRVDWTTLDAQVKNRVVAIVEGIRGEEPPVAVTLREIERRLKERENWIYLRQRKLPVTMAFLAVAIESVDAFQERRLRYNVDRAIAAGDLITVSGVIRAASLRYELWRERAKAMIDDAEGLVGLS